MVELAAPELPSFAGAVLGTVSRAPTGLGQSFEVLVPTFSTEHSYLVRRWQSRGLTVPAVDDEVLVVEDQNRLPWVVAWWPAGGDAPVPTPAELAAARTLLLARAATTAALPTNTLTGNVLEASANGALGAQDGVTLAVGDRLFNWKEATSSAKHGIFEVTSLGSAGSKWKLTRISTMNESAEVVPGMQVRVAQGTQYGALTFSLLTTGAITLGTTALTFGYAGGWIEPTFTANWKNYEAANFPKVAYRKSFDNRVTLRGIAQPTVAGQNLIFNLPAGFRPSSQGVNGQGFACIAGNGAGDVINRLEIKPNGDVWPGFAFAGTIGTYYIFLDPVSFYAD